MAATDQSGVEQLRQGRPLQLCVFDERRGEQEGQEQDKVLGFYPAQVPLQEQGSVVGLTQAMLTFANTFQPDAPCEAVHTEHSQWVVNCCEPHIWLLLMVERDWHKGPAREAGLVATLRQLHQLISLTHSPIQNLLTQDSSGRAARRAIEEVLYEFGDRLARRRGPEYSALHNPLAACEAAPLLQLPQPLFLSMQSLVNRVLVSPIWNGAPVSGVVLLHEHWLLWSTLPQQDTNSLYQLFSWAILPAIKGASQSSFGRRLTRSTAASREALGTKRPSLLNRDTWQLRQNGLLLLSAAPPEQALSGPEIILHTPSVWLQGAQEWCSLLILRVGDEVLLVLLPGDSPATQPVAESCIAVAAPLMKGLSSTVAQHLQAIRRQHIPTFRYLFTDDLLSAVRASPGNKVATLSRSSLALVNAVRADIEAQLPSKQETRHTEVTVWGQHDCWVAANCDGQHQLFVVLEQQGKEGLVDACGCTEAFAKTHFPGLFY